MKAQSERSTHFRQLAPSASSPPNAQEVAGDVLRIFRAISEDVAGHEEALFRGMEHLLGGPSRFAWSDLCELYRRGFRCVPIPPEEYAAQMVRHPTFAPVLRLFGLVASPSLLYLVGNRFGLARTFSHIQVDQSVRDDGRIELQLTIPENYEDSPEFFRVTRGILQALPGLIGISDARVDLELNPRKGRYVIFPPPSMTLWARLRRWFTAFFLGRTALKELTRQQNSLNEQIRELTKARSELEHALRAKQRFLSLISHELRTPLNGLVGGAAALGDAKNAKTRGELIDTIQRSSEQMERVVLNLLEYTRLEDGAAQPQVKSVPLGSLFEGPLRHGRARSKETGIAFDVRSDALTTAIEIDVARAQQIAWHMLDNAFKFTSRGLVRADVRLTEGPDATLTFTVDDTGPGVDPEHREHIFSLFTVQDDSTTRKHAGAGIGLPLCRRLSELLGGTLVMEESELGGARFTSRLPCRRSVPSTELSPIEQVCPRLLVVDDNRINRKILRHILERLRWEVFEAENGREAISRVQERSFAAIFMDCAMPVMDGFEATRHIRRLVGQGARIIATTAYVTDDDRARCLAAGMNDFLPKPVKAAVIAEALARWTGAASPHEATVALQ